MRLPVVLIDSLQNDVPVLYRTDQLLEDEALKLEAAHMAIISHYSQYVSDDEQVEVLVEYRGN